MTLLMSEIKTSSDGELRASLFPLAKGVSDETRNTIDGLVAVLDAANQWMPIQDLTDMALLDGVRTTSANPSRVFSTALSNERGKENPRVVLHNNKWGLSHWDRPRRRRVSKEKEKSRGDLTETVRPGAATPGLALSSHPSQLL